MKDHSQALVLELLTKPGAGKTLWVLDDNPVLEDFIRLNGRKDIEVLSNRFDIGQKMARLGLSAHLSDFDFSQLPPYQRIVYRISKEKMLTHHVINAALRNLAPDGTLYLIGGKQDGMKSIAKNAAEVYQQDVVARKYGTAYLAEFSPCAEGLIASAYLPDASYTELRRVEHPQMSFYSKPGVFGWEKIDKGSQLLVSCLPKVMQYMKDVSSVLDLGCGWGYLMLQTAGSDIVQRVATDNNVAAIDAARRNFAETGINVDCVLDDAGSHINQRFDLILCNPPFHQGFSVSDSLIEKFLANASRLSRRSTRAVFVVNQFIPLETLAPKYFSECRELAAADGFQVFELRP